MLTSTINDTMAMPLIVLGGLLLFTVLIQASLFHGYPLSQLGQRPIQGRGIFEYMYYGSSITRQIGVWGYDPIQGAFAPLLRLMCHCSFLLMLWGGSIYLYTATIPIAAAATTNLKINTEGNFVIGGIVLVVYLVHCYVLYYILPGVSVPPGPRPHKIQRLPQWEDQYWNIFHDKPCTQDAKQAPTTSSSSSSQIHIRYVHGQESHTISEQIHNTTHKENYTTDVSNGSIHHQYRLTGEPAGRDMWTTSTTIEATTTSTQPHKTGVSNDAIRELASGGRTYTGFNPNINPNRYMPPIQYSNVYIAIECSTKYCCCQTHHNPYYFHFIYSR